MGIAVIRSGIAAASLLLGLTACVNNGQSSAAPTNPSRIAATYQTARELKPNVAPPEFANLILSGTPIPVRLQEVRSGNSLTLDWLADPDGETGGDPVQVESEKYTFSDSYFAFAGTEHEQYDPPISLVKYPFEVGTPSDWAGLVIVGKIKTKATAEITSEAETLNLAVGNIDTVAVTVQISFEGESAPKTRQLKFWFQPGAGVIKRELWSSSTREPRPEPGGNSPER